MTASPGGSLEPAPDVVMGRAFADAVTEVGPPVTADWIEPGSGTQYMASCHERSTQSFTTGPMNS